MVLVQLSWAEVLDWVWARALEVELVPESEEESALG